MGSRGQGWGPTLASVLLFVQFLLSFGNPSCHFLEHGSVSLVGEGGAIQEFSCPWSWSLVFSLDVRPEAGTSEWWDGPLDGTEWYGMRASMLALLS